jgi:hypothetical protein
MTGRFNGREKHIDLDNNHAPRLPTVIKGLKLPGVTPVAKTDQCSQVSHL